MTTKQTALSAYIAKTDAIQAKITRLQQLADGYFNHDAEEISWAHVGDLGRIEAALGEILNEGASK
jgi:hypothetical protein